MDVLGSRGNLVVPTHTAGNRDPGSWIPPVPPEQRASVRDQLPGFDPALMPSQGMGAVAECVRLWPGARRSAHPQVSIGALGPDASWLTRDHEPTCHHGEQSPLPRLEQLDARILLLGVGWKRCTAFHLAEYRQLHPPTREYSCAVTTAQGRRWVRYRDVVLDDSSFAELGKDLERSSGPGRSVICGPVGQATARLTPIRTAVSFAVDWLATVATRTRAELTNIERMNEDSWTDA